MADHVDGSIVINTELDNKGFAAGSKELLAAIKSLTSEIKQLNNQFGSAFANTQKAASNSSKTVKDLEAQVSGLQTQVKELESALKGVNDQVDSQGAKKLSAAFDTTAARTSVSSLQRELSSLSADLSKLDSAADRAMGETATPMELFSRRADAIADKINELQSKLGEMHDAQIPTEEYAQAESEIQSVQAALDKLTARQSKMDATGVNQSSKAYKNLLYDIDNATRRLEDLKKLQSYLADNGQAFISGADTEQYAQLSAQLEELQQKYDALCDSVDRYERKGTSAFSTLGRILSASFQLGAKAAISALGSVLNSVKSLAQKGMNKLAVGVKKVVSSLFGMNKGLGNTNKGFSHSLKTLVSYSLGIRTLYSLVNKLRSAMVEGFKNLARYSSSTNAAISSVMSALTQLKNSIATAFDPILTVAAPALTTLINKLSEAASHIAMFTAALTGQATYKKATAVQEDYAASLNGTADAAKNANKQLLSIDELNVLDDTASSSSGSAGSTDPSQMFEEVPVDSSIKSFADMLRDAFNAADWEGLGTLLGEKFNALVDSIDWAGIGTKLGYGLNGAIQTLYYFLDTADWVNLGGHIAELVNHALNEIDFEFVGRLLAKKFTIGWDLFIGFLTELDWTEVLNKVTDGINGFFNELTDWLNSKNWRQLGSLFSQKLSDALQNVDLQGAVVAFTTNLTVLFNSVANFLDEVDFRQLGSDLKNKVVESVSAIDWQNLSEAFGRAVGGALAAGINFFGGIFEDIAAYFQAKIDEGPFDAVGANIVYGILAGINDGLASIGTWIYNNVFKPFWNGICDAFEIHSPSKKMAEIGGYIVDGMIEGIKDAFNRCKTAVTTWASNVKDWFTKGVTKTQFADHAKDLVDGFKSKISSYCTQAQTAVKKWASNVKDWFTKGVTKTQFADHAKDLVDSFKSKISSYYTQAQAAVKTWGSKIKTWFTTYAKSSDFVTHAQTLVNSFKTGISNNYSKAQSAVTTFASNVKTWFTNLISGETFRKIAVDVINGFKNGITQKVETAKSAVKDLANDVVEKGKEILGVHSPSTVFYAIAKYVVLGFVNGIIENKGDASAAIEGMMSDAVQAARDGSEDILEEWDGTWSSLLEVTQTQGEKTKQLIDDGIEDCTSSLTEFSGAISGIGGSISSLGEKLNAPWLTSVGNFVQGCGDGITAVVDFANNVKTAYDSIQEFAKKFDTLKTVVGQVLNTTEGEATTWGGSFMQKLSDGLTNGESILKGALSTVKNWISNAFGEKSFLSTIWSKGQSILTNLKNGLQNNGDSSFITGVCTTVKNWISNAFGSNSWLSTIFSKGTAIAQNLANGVKGSSAQSFISTALTTVWGWIQSILGSSSWLQTIFSLGQNVIQWFAKGMSGAGDFVSSALKGIANLVNGNGNGLGGIINNATSLINTGGSNILSNLGQIGSKLLSGAGNIGSNLLSTLGNLSGGVGSAVSGIWSKLGTLATGAGSTLSSLGSGVLSVLGNVGSTIGGGLSTLASGVGAALGGIGSTVGAGLSSVLGGIGGVASSIGAGIGTAAAGVGSTLAGIGGTIASFASSIVTGPVGIAAGIAGLAATITGLIGKASGGNGLVGCLTQGVQTIGSTIGSVLSGAWNGVKSVASGVGNAVKTVASGVWNGVKTVAKGVANVVTAPFRWLGSLFSAGGGIFPARSKPTLFAGGGSAKHGSMFVAGEAGAELVGHIGGRTEVLNQFQLAEVMRTAVMQGMAQFTGYWQTFNNQMVTCTNAIINAVLTGADTLSSANISTINAALSEWAALSDRISAIAASPAYTVPTVATGTVTPYSIRAGALSSSERGYTSDEAFDWVRTFYYENVEPTLKQIAADMKRQADKEEKTTVQIGNRVISDAVTTQQKANGYSFTK